MLLRNVLKRFTVMIEIEVSYASPQTQKLISLNVGEGSSVVHAIMQSGILDLFPEIVLKNNVGIFSKKVPLDQPLKNGDRIEIYRPLTCSPNQARLRRVGKKLK